MKESRFIELLNLYVDQQLTAAEAAELEMEIHRDQARRSTYQQYCRMQKACTRLFEQEREGAPASTALARALAEADRKIVAFPETRSAWRQRGAYVAGLTAIAACLAFVFVRQTPAPQAAPLAATPTSTDVAATVPVIPSAQAQLVIIPPADGANRSRAASYSILATNRFGPLRAISTNTRMDSTENQQSFEWMNRVDLPPMRRPDLGTFAFEMKATLPPTKNVFEAPLPQATPGGVENTAFQFQK